MPREVSGLPAIADDSGLEVDALRGAPGIYSARYAGPGADDAANNERLLRDLAAVPDAERSARYRCAMVYLRWPLDPAPLVCQASWEGRIGRLPRGTRRLRLRPAVPRRRRAADTAAELEPAHKNGSAIAARRCARWSRHSTEPGAP